MSIRNGVSVTVKKQIQPESLEEKSFPVVGVGASAGGLEAFTQLVRSLPIDTGMAFVLVQHLAPDHKSLLADILSRQTRLPVSEVKHKTRVEPNHVYVIPPKVQMSIQGGVLNLVPREEHTISFMPIDYFLNSLAADKGSDAVAVILSGGDGDGSHALEAIKAGGGITFAQDSKSAKIDSMPAHATATGLVDFVLPPEQIAQELARIARDPTAVQLRKSPGEEILSKESDYLAKIYKLLHRDRGVDFSNYKQGTLRRRIARRMIVQKVSTLKDYTKLLTTQPAEVMALFDDILIHVTEFFRDIETFAALKTMVFPRLMKDRKPNDPIRIWVPGCATGEVVYSILICLLEFLGGKATRHDIQVFGTDISDKPLQRARVGIYSEQALAQVSIERRRRFFTQVSGGFQIAKSLQNLCVFAKQNVAKDPPFSKVDLISCRNVLIYLGPVLQQRIMATLHYALKPSGVLLLGNSETLGTYFDLFSSLDKKVKIFAKKQISMRLHPLFHASDYPVETTNGEPPKAPSEATGPNMLKEADQYILEKRAPAGVIIDGAMNIVQFRGSIKQYLELSAGMANHNLFKLAKDGLLLELRPAIEKAKKDRSSVKVHGSRIKVDGHYKTITIEVTPLKQTSSGDPHFLVLFEEAPQNIISEGKPGKLGRQGSPAALRAAESEIARLKKEQAAGKDYLQSIISQQEAVNEELKSAHEEVLSSNEEYQSSNEELETAKEELQATNEETTTLNDELNNRNADLSDLNSDLVNLMESANVPIVILGRDHHVRRLTPAAEKVLDIAPTDVGRSIHGIKLSIVVPDLEAQIASVLKTLVAEQREIQDGAGHWYSMRIQLYKTVDDKIDGVVLAFSDIQLAKERQAAATEWAKTLETRVKQRTEELVHTQSALHQAEKLEALGRLAGGVAHDFNNLMTGILGITDEIQMELGPTSPHRENLELVVNAAQKATALTKQLLAFGRRQLTVPRVLNLNQVIGSMEALFTRLLGEDVEVKMVLDPQAGPVKLDEGQLEQLIVNLGLNARDAMWTGGKLTIETSNIELKESPVKRLFDAPSGRYVMLTVSDTGCGMTPKTLSRMFEPFFTTKEEGKGTGLGLSNVYGIVKQAGGDIAVESEPQKGTTFRIYFPRAEGPSDSDRRNFDRGDAQGGSETVLVVEDEDIVRKVSVRALRKKGYHVLHASSPDEAIKISERHPDPIHLLLTDVIMPGMNGHELGKMITSKRPATKILYMSGYNEDIIGQRGVQDNGVNFIEKTFTSEGLCHKVREVLNAAQNPATNGNGLAGLKI